MSYPASDPAGTRMTPYAFCPRVALAVPTVNVGRASCAASTSRPALAGPCDANSITTTAAPTLLIVFIVLSSAHETSVRLEAGHLR